MSEQAVSGSATFLSQVGIESPIICGAMYPCSNPELVGNIGSRRYWYYSAHCHGIRPWA